MGPRRTSSTFLLGSLPFPFYLFRALKPTISPTTISCVSRKGGNFEKRFPELPLSSWSGSASTSLDFFLLFPSPPASRSPLPHLRLAHIHRARTQICTRRHLFQRLCLPHGLCFLSTNLSASNSLAYLQRLCLGYQPKTASSPEPLGISHCLFEEFSFSLSRATSNYQRGILSHHGDPHSE